MADLIIPTRQTVPNLVEGVKPPWALADQSGMRSFGAALERTAGQAADKFIDIRAGNEYNEFLGTAKAKEQEMTNLIAQNPYATEQQLTEWRDKTLQGIQDAAGKLTTNRARQWANRSYLSQMDAIKLHFDGVIAGQVQKQEVEKFKLQEKELIETGEYEKLKDFYQLQIEAGMLPADTEDENDTASLIIRDGLRAAMANRQEMEAQARKEMQAQARDSIRGAVWKYYTTSPNYVNNRELTIEDKKKAREIVLSMIQDYIKEGVFSEGDAFVDKKIIDNEVDDTFYEFMKKEKDAEKATVIDTYQTFADKLANGTFTGDDIALSSLDKDEKDIWVSILAGSRKDAPMQASYAGYRVAGDTLSDFATGKIGKKEALNNILTERYINQSITDKQFKYALDKIKDPYPEHVANTLKMAAEHMTSGEYKGNLYHRGVGLLGNDWLDSNEKNAYVNATQSLTSWMEYEKDKSGRYPDPSSIFNKLKEFKVIESVPAGLPSVPAVRRPAPDQSDPAYVVTDDDFASIPVGTEFYSELLGEWVTKEKE